MVGTDQKIYDKLEDAKRFFELFHKDCNYLTNIYRADGTSVRDDGLNQRAHSLNSQKQWASILWSNLNILLPSIYQKAPKAYVDRRFHDKDPIGRSASEILERVMDFCIAESGFDDAVRDAVKEQLICGQGTVWLRYDPKFYSDEDVEDHVVVEHVSWDNFLCSPSDKWSNVTWVARRVFLSKKAFKNTFHEDPSKYPIVDEDRTRVQYTTFGSTKIHKDMYPIWEFWDKEEKKVYFVVDGCGKIVKEMDDFLGLDGFFPCPRPYFATTTANTIIPVPDYKEYAPLATEINELTRRIILVTSAIRSVGFYDDACPEIAELFEQADETQLIPVKDYTQFMTSGGSANAVQWLPNDQNAQTAQVLSELRQGAIDALAEISGITQEARGSTDAAETATAQNIKAENASIKLKSRQDECFRFVSDITKIFGEIIVKHFSKDSLLHMSNFDQEEDYTPELFEKSYKFLQDFHGLKYRIQVEAESLMEANMLREQQSRTEFLNVVTGFIGQAAQISTVIPDIIPLMKDLLLFNARAFKVGRELEIAIEQNLDHIQEKMQQMQQQAQQQNPNAPPGAPQTIIQQDAPKPLQPQDLLKANSEFQKQMVDVLKEKMNIDKEVFLTTNGQEGKIWSVQEVNSALNAIRTTNKESDLQELQWLGGQQAQAQAQNQPQQPQVPPGPQPQNTRPFM